ncbi:MAG TPA: pyridoxal-5'-phosphate-dependent protein subunit beta, partial [Rhodospirillaceae bacterium]|nr:pyridoxal-5'-phosphate-dependent protein subunit beta [Rhodospirillaceae bacterium]
MTELPQYLNPRTDSVWPVGESLCCAPDDGGYVNLTPGNGLDQKSIETSLPSLWRYRDAIRLPGTEVASLGEGWTPMVTGRWAGQDISMKMEYLMPSGSFKDRGTAVMMNYLKQVGVTTILEDSSGNAGSSVATYSAYLGFDSRIFVPAQAPLAKRRQMAALGADVVAVEGSRDDVAAAARREAESRFYAGHNLQPYFLEGTKTLAFEIWEQFGFDLPDAIVIPMGQGSNVMGCHIGFDELRRAGMIDRLPRIYAIQAENAAPYYAAWAANSETPVEIEAKPTIADGIASSKPVRLREVLAALRETGGDAIAVSEIEIRASLGELCRIGFFVEPTTAAGAAGLTRLIEDGSIRDDERVVLILTG